MSLSTRGCEGTLRPEKLNVHSIITAYILTWYQYCHVHTNTLFLHTNQDKAKSIYKILSNIDFQFTMMEEGWKFEGL